jgi:hypothetical protein
MALSTREMAALIGKTGMFRTYNQAGDQPLTFPVDILDARNRYGTTDVLITPIGGDGERWVESGSVVVVAAE